MGGGGGVSGAVTFPDYIQDVHGHLMAGSPVANDGQFSGAPSYPIKNVAELLTAAWTTDPFAAFSFTNPNTELAQSKSQFDLYYSAVTAVSQANYANYITKALLAVTQPSTAISNLAVSLATSAPSSPQTLFANFATTTRAEITKFLSGAHSSIKEDIGALLSAAATSALSETTLSAATTFWRSLVSAATSELGKCDFPREVSVPAIINKAAHNASDNLKAALRIVRDIVSGTIISEVITAYENRREITYQSQISQFAGGMADINAVNSSAFMIGQALLRAEQMREVAEFDSQISFQVLQQGLSFYIQTHSTQLQVSAQVELNNSRAHNALLEASINMLATLRRREEILPTDLLSMYGGLFQAELSAYAGLSQRGLNELQGLYGQNVGKDRLSHTLNLEADRINKLAREQRYQQGLGQVLSLLSSRTEFERLAASLLTDQNRIKIIARAEYEGDTLDLDIRDQLWELEVAEVGARLLAAPAGMSAAMPRKPSKASTALGGALQGAGAGAAAGSVIPGVGTAVGAGVGALLGGVGGLLQ